MNILLVIFAAFLSICSGQVGFSSRSLRTTRQPNFNHGFHGVTANGRRQILDSNQQFGDNLNINQDNIRFVPQSSRRSGVARSQMFRDTDINMGIMPSSRGRVGTTNQIRIDGRNRPNVRQEVLRRISRRLNRPTNNAGPIREGYVGARGGVDGFPVHGGYCPGEACKDGGLAAGVGYGIGSGHLQAFLERRRTGRNDDIRIYERFASGPGAFGHG